MSLTRNSGIIPLLPQASIRAASLNPLLQFNSQCEEGEVCTFFFSVQQTGASVIPTTAQLIIQLDWEYHKGTGSITFDLIQGVSIRIPCNVATARVIYLGKGPAYTVWAARVDDVTNALPVTMTQRILMGPNATGAYLPVPSYSKAIKLLSTASPRTNTIAFFGAEDPGSIISQEVVTDASDQSIPNGAAFFQLTNGDGTAQVISAVATLQL